MDLKTMRRHLRAIEREVECQLKNQTACCGVTLAQCHVLLELAELGHANLVELSERLRLDTSTLSRTVEGLVRAGLVDRVPDSHSRRAVRLSLKGEGTKKVALIDLSCNQFYGDLLARYPKGKQAALVEALGLLAEIFAGMRQPPGCAPPEPKSSSRRRGK